MRRKPPRTSRRCTLPVTNLKAMADHPLCAVMSRNLAIDADKLELHADPKCMRTRGIINDMRRLSGWYQSVKEQR